MIKLKYFFLKNLIPIALLFLLIGMFFNRETSIYINYISHLFFILVYIYLLGIKRLVRSFNSVIGLFIFYLLIITIISFLSGHYGWSSFYSWQSFFLIYFSYYIGFHLINDEQRIKLLITQIKNAAIIYIIYFVVIQFFEFSFKSYESYSGIFNIGVISSRRLLFISYTIITLFLGINFYQNKSNKKKLFLILFLILFFISLIILRRTVILISFIGILIFVVNNFNFKKISLLFFYSAIAALIFSFTFKDVFQIQLNYRSNQTGFTITHEEARFSEILMLSEYINNETDKQIFFGNLNRFETFEFWRKYGGANNRAIHSDFVFLIYSSGLIGFFLFIIVYSSLIIKHRKIKAQLKKKAISDKNVKPLNSVFYSLIICNLLLLYSGTFFYLLHGMISFLFIGASTGYIKKLNSVY
jgi:hypothetical protein